MRDTSDMMEDAISEDTMMECSGEGGGLEDLVNLATDIADSAPSIRDAAARLLTLLGVDDDDDISSSEDEGVEVDLDDSDEEEPQDTRLLHQLAASLAQELKYAKQNSSNSKIVQGHTVADNYGRDPVQSMDFAPESNTNNENSPSNNFHQLSPGQNPFARYNHSDFYQSQNDFGPTRFKTHTQHLSFTSSNENHFSPHPPDYPGKQQTFGSTDIHGYATSLQGQTEILPAYYQPPLIDPRLRVDGIDVRSQESFPETSSWGAGWDSCASEALRYLVEDEGLPPHHPTVIAMKNHLDVQRERVFAQYTA